MELDGDVHVAHPAIDHLNVGRENLPNSHLRIKAERKAFNSCAEVTRIRTRDGVSTESPLAEAAKRRIPDIEVKIVVRRRAGEVQASKRLALDARDVELEAPFRKADIRDLQAHLLVQTTEDAVLAGRADGLWQRTCLRIRNRLATADIGSIRCHQVGHVIEDARAILEDLVDRSLHDRSDIFPHLLALEGDQGIVNAGRGMNHFQVRDRVKQARGILADVLHLQDVKNLADLLVHEKMHVNQRHKVHADVQGLQREGRVCA
mmetsp:Transcript_1023/g.4379  ORF Transcript_1023/g.4379 Transcript_1023/m.4379 type:complete len:262 (-) Transcript_1023:1095-1880(-)